MIRRGTLLAVLLMTAGAATAHPVARLHRDRTILVRITEGGIVVEYVLAQDAWTAASDLVALRSDQPPPQTTDQLYQQWGQAFGPRLANGLVGRLDGRELAFTCAGFQIKVEDHLRYTFQFKAPLALAADRPTHRLTVIDSNFHAEPGQFRMGARGEGEVAFKQASVPADPELAKPVQLGGFAQGEKEHLRTATVTFTVPAAPPATATAPAPPPPPATAPEAAPAAPPKPPPGLWELAKSLDVRQLAESDLGLGLLLVLAFGFGAIHALQPGHGKTLVAAYLVGSRGTVGQAFFLGLVTTLTHTFTVILLALVLPLIYPEGKNDAAFALELGGGVLVTLMAFWLLLRRLAGEADHVHLFGGHHHHHHGPGGHHHHHLPPPGEKVTWWALITLGVTGGLVPCVDALALLALTFLTGKLWLGLPLILAFSGGLAAVLVGLGVLVVKFRRFAEGRWGQGRWVTWLPIVSAVLTLLLGLWMCQQALRHREQALTETAAGAVVPGCPGERGA